MQTTYSVAEARNQFAALIHQVEADNKPVQVTRRGKPVAVILSQAEYQRLLAQQPKQAFGQRHLAWREDGQVDEWKNEPDPFAEVRDRTPGREVNLWD